MKQLFFALALAALPALANDTPRGNLIEVHSCELYAGGCTVSSEAPQGGRYMVRVWDFTGGQFAQTELKGLQIAALQLSTDNLAMPGAKVSETIVYLPESASPAQRDALLAWFKSSPQGFASENLRTRTVPFTLTRSAQEQTFKAGEFLSVKTGPLEACEMGGCGEALWYEPRTSTSVFAVAVNRASEVTEPLLKLKWADSQKRSVFVGKFGQAESSRDVFVTMNEICGPDGLF